MSRFFATGDTESEASSSESEEEVKGKPAVKQLAQRRTILLSDDEDEEKRVVRSAKDKRFEELSDVIKTINNSKKIKDVSKVVTCFESLQKLFAKSKSVIDKEGVPRFFIKALAELEDFAKELWEDKDAKQKLNKINAKALATLRQKTRKYNRDFEESILEYRENPGEESDEEDDEVKVEEPAPAAVAAIVDEKDEEETVVAKDKVMEDDEESDGLFSDDDMDYSSSSGDSTSDIEITGGYYTKEMFLKKDKTKDEEKKKRKVTIRKPDQQQKHFSDDEDGWEKVGSDKGKSQEAIFQEKLRQLFPKDVDINEKSVLKKRNEILDGHCKTAADRMEQINQLQLLHQIVVQENMNAAMWIRFAVDIIGCMFEFNLNVFVPMKDDMWKSCCDLLGQLVEALQSNPDLELIPDLLELDENLTNPSQQLIVSGSILVFVERMDDEFTKILLNTDAHSTLYVERLQDEKMVYHLICEVQKYLETREGDSRDTNLCRIYIRRVEHLYYKVDRSTFGKELEPPSSDGEENNAQLLTRLTTFIYHYNGTDLGRIRTRAMLCHIYYHALHNRWFQARDLMLMSHLQEASQTFDIVDQLLYNRTLVQLGMCAFRHGMTRDAHDALVDIQSSQRSKELLAQGLVANRDRTPEQEKIERRRQMPFHMHINLELMECVYLTSAMLMEVPYLAQTAHEGRRRMISKGFHHQLKQHNKQALTGPPETMREHVVAAATAMQLGNWKQCLEYIFKIKAWDLFINVEEVKTMLSQKIREETLRTYIFTYGEVYNSLSLEMLSETFELPLEMVHCIVSKMIMKEELLGSLDEPTQSIILHHAQPTQLQTLALQLSEKVANLAEQNEEMMKLKHAGPWTMSTFRSNVGTRRDGADMRKGDMPAGGAPPVTINKRPPTTSAWAH
ncbi:eukaryotic translation initiation factor 3 subunit C-like isoform X2 [Dysidea avara]|uniref:eukaryotic translation initiation factor 3 subunit C-like isoform X2 n=1 Tax=Dysidea avara TaxID=196820 RepID=UPI0033175082